MECAQIAVEKKAEEITVLDLRKLSSVSDYFVLCSGSSAKQLQAVADAIRAHLRDSGLGKGVFEGYDSGSWVLLEAEDVVIHLFRHEMRRFYDLESLWAEAKKVPWRKKASTTKEALTGP